MVVIWKYIRDARTYECQTTSRPRRLGSICVWPAEVHLVAFWIRPALL